MTIHEQREKELDSLVFYTKDREIAKQIMRRFYKLGIIEQQLLEMNNKEIYYTDIKLNEIMTHKESQSIELCMYLNNFLKKYGLKLYVSGGYPKIIDAKTRENVIYGVYYRR